MAKKIPLISDVVARLLEMQKEHGDLPVAVSESAEYWGSVETFAGEDNIAVQENAQPNGPKKEGMKCVVFGYNI
jgi:hypothetical protein